MLASSAFVVGHALFVPTVAVPVVALLSVVTWPLLRGQRLPGRDWQVPQTWGRLGAKVYAAAFGAILGLGVLTRIPSLGFYTLLAWAATAAAWSDAALVMGAFGASRSVPTIAAAVVAERLRSYPANLVEQTAFWTRRITPLEIGLLAAVAATSASQLVS